MCDHDACVYALCVLRVSTCQGVAFRGARAEQDDRKPACLCGGRTSLEGNNSRSICYGTFFVYFLTMASTAGCEIMNSEVAGSTLTVFPVKRKNGILSFMFKNLWNSTTWKQRWEQYDHCKSLHYRKSRIGYWVSHRGSWHNQGNTSGWVGENIVENEFRRQ